MSGKQISIGSKPSSQGQGRLNFEAESWVETRQISKNTGEMKRLTIDVPVTLHRQIKSQCAERGLNMSDAIRSILFEQYSMKE